MARKRKHSSAVPQVHLELRTPFSEALEASITALYEACGVRCVSRRLEVCFCSCCMSEATRQEIIATPNAKLTPEHIQEYSNSAHGTVSIGDDLIVLLPRYAELLAQDITVDYNESDEIFWRFGALMKKGGMPRDVQEAYFAWGRAYFRHAAYAEAKDLDTILCAYSAMKLLLSGGWSGSEMIALLYEACMGEGEGALTTSCLACHMFGQKRGQTQPPKLDFIWKYGLAEQACEEVLAWFKGPVFKDALERAMLTDVPEELFMACYIAHDWIAANA